MIIVDSHDRDGSHIVISMCVAVLPASILLVMSQVIDIFIRSCIGFTVDTRAYSAKLAKVTYGLSA